MKTEFYTLPSGERMAWYEWGERENPRVLVCVHGLTRNGRDFDFLARALPGWRILCPDMLGRGLSDRLPPERYTYPEYAKILGGWLAQLNITKTDWVGTSMGGILGMILAAQNPGLIKKMVLNDIGPFIPSAGLKRIAGYAGKLCSFGSREEGEAALRTIYTPFGISEPEQWQHFFDHSLVERDGHWELAYDPAIANAFKDVNAIKDIDLWMVWDRITCPVLVMRGEISDILIRPTVSYMTARKNVQAVEIPGIGHAPTLMQPGEIEMVKEWLS